MIVEVNQYSLDVVGKNVGISISSITVSVLVLTLQSCTIDGHSSTPGMSQQHLHRLEWRYL